MKAKQVIYALAIITVMVSMPFFALAQGNDKAAKYGLSVTATGTQLVNLTLSQQTPESLAARIISIVLMFTGTIFFLLLVYAGLSWMLAMGSSEKVTRAKEILETAIIGLIIVAASYAASLLIFSRLTAGTEITTCQEMGGACADMCGEGLQKYENVEDCASPQVCCLPAQ